MPELMSDITSYRHFMNASGGGVTASGGEAMLQQNFIAELFAACKEKGIHTCLDTNGFVRHYDEQLDKVLDNTDLVLLDIKQINDDKHIPLTHVSNKYTLEFARYLAAKGKTMWIRYVVVPTWSDDDECRRARPVHRRTGRVRREGGATALSRTWQAQVGRTGRHL